MFPRAVLLKEHSLPRLYFRSRIVSESKRADRGIETTIRVEIQGERSVGRIFGAGSVGKERL